MKKKKTVKHLDESPVKKSGNKSFTVVIGIITALLAVVLIRLIWINIFDGSKYTQAALSQTEKSATTISAKRGDIVDCNGITLATSTKVYNLILDPKVILSDQDRYMEPTIAALHEYFDYESSEIRSLIMDNPSRSYIVLEKELTYAQIEDFVEKKAEKGSNIVGVWTEESYKRNYTFGNLASSVLGFMDGGKGAYGLEAWYDKELTGVDGREYTYVNSDNNVETVVQEPENGYKLKLTLNETIQSCVKRVMDKFMEEYPAKSAACVIQDPNTGAILAMEDTGDFDCNNPRDLSAFYTEEELDAMSDEEFVAALSERWKNFCVTETYEPGSTFKPFTLAAGLEEQKVLMDDTYVCYGSSHFLDKDVYCHVRVGHGELDTLGAIQESCNVALMEMIQKIGPSIFVKYQNKFGFGQYTDIDLPNEASCAGLLYDEDMSELDLATNSFGQNFNLTMIQMISAYSSLINGGYYYKPYIVKGIYSDDGELISSNSKTLVSRTISGETSDIIKKCLRAVVVNGTGDYAAIDGYVISGKTGTAEKRGREDGVYLVSFIGFAPYDDPGVLCYVVIDEPEAGDEHGVSSKLFHNIMSEVLPLLNIKTADQDDDPYKVSVTGPAANTTPDVIEEETTAGEESEGNEEGEAGGKETWWSGEEDYYEETYYEEGYYEEGYYEDNYYYEEDYGY